MVAGIWCVWAGPHKDRRTSCVCMCELMSDCNMMIRGEPFAQTFHTRLMQSYTFSIIRFCSTWSKPTCQQHEVKKSKLVILKPQFRKRQKTKLLTRQFRTTNEVFGKKVDICVWRKILTLWLSRTDETLKSKDGQVTDGQCSFWFFRWYIIQQIT